MAGIAGWHEMLVDESFVSQEQADAIVQEVEQLAKHSRKELDEERQHQIALLLALRINQSDIQGAITMPAIMSARDWLCENFGSVFPELCRDREP